MEEEEKNKEKEQNDLSNNKKNAIDNDISHNNDNQNNSEVFRHMNNEKAIKNEADRTKPTRFIFIYFSDVKPE